MVFLFSWLSISNHHHGAVKAHFEPNFHTHRTHVRLQTYVCPGLAGVGLFGTPMREVGERCAMIQVRMDCVCARPLVPIWPAGNPSWSPPLGRVADDASIFVCRPSGFLGSRAYGPVNQGWIFKGRMWEPPPPPHPSPLSLKKAAPRNEPHVQYASFTHFKRLCAVSGVTGNQVATAGRATFPGVALVLARPRTLPRGVPAMPHAVIDDPRYPRR